MPEQTREPLITIIEHMSMTKEPTRGIEAFAYLRKALGFGFDLYWPKDGWCLDIYLGPLTIEIQYAER